MSFFRNVFGSGSSSSDSSNPKPQPKPRPQPIIQQQPPPLADASLPPSGMFAGLSMKAENPATPPRTTTTRTIPTNNVATTSTSTSGQAAGGSLLSMLNSFPAASSNQASLPGPPTMAASTSESAFSFLRTSTSTPPPTLVSSASVGSPSIETHQTDLKPRFGSEADFGSSLPNASSSSSSAFEFLSQSRAPMPPLSGTNKDYLPKNSWDQASGETHQEVSEANGVAGPMVPISCTNEAVDTSEQDLTKPKYELSQFDEIYGSNRVVNARSQSTPDPSMRDVFAGMLIRSGGEDKKPPVLRAKSANLPDRETQKNPDARGDEDEDTSTDRLLVQKQNEFGRYMAEHWNSLRALDAEKAEVVQKQYQMVDDISALRSEIASLEDQQSHAVDQEQYDRADEIDSLMQSKRSRLDDLELERKSLDSFFDECGARLQRLNHDAQERARLFSESLNNLKEETAKETQAYVNEQTEQISRDDAHLDEEMSRFERIMDIITSDLDRVEAEQADIDRSIRERTQEEHIEKEKYVSLKTEVESELEKLRQEVADKESALEKVVRSLNDAEAKIEQARTAYTRQIIRLTERRDRIVNERQEMEVERKEVEEKKQEIDRRKKSVSKHEVHIRELAETVTQQVQATASMSVCLNSYEVLQTKWLYQDQRLCKLVECASARVSQCSRSIEALRARQTLLETDSTTHRSNIESIQARLPELILQKKDAVTARDFKSASRISKELKALGASMEESKQTIEDHADILGGLEEELVTADAKLEKAVQGRQSAQRKLDEYRFDIALQRRQILRKLLNWAMPEEQGILRQIVDEVQGEAEFLANKYGWDVPEPESVASLTVDENGALLKSDAERMTSLTPEIENIPNEVADDDNSTGSEIIDDVEEPTTTLEELEAQLEIAVEADDFDAAITLQDQITVLQSRSNSASPQPPAQSEDDRSSRESSLAPSQDSLSVSPSSIARSASPAERVPSPSPSPKRAADSLSVSPCPESPSPSTDALSVSPHPQSRSMSLNPSRGASEHLDGNDAETEKEAEPEDDLGEGILNEDADEVAVEDVEASADGIDEDDMNAVPKESVDPDQELDAGQQGDTDMVSTS